MREFSAEDFKPANIDKSNEEDIKIKSIGFWKDAWLRFRSNKGAMLGLMLIISIGLCSIIFPLLSKYKYYEQIADLKMESSQEFVFGTDSLGRDLWTRVWVGSGISMIIAFLAAFLDLVIGVTYGSISGYFGGRVDSIMQRIMEILYGIPNLIIIVLMLLIMDAGILPIALAMALTGWFNMARVVRAQVLKLKSYEYVLASRTLGAGHKRILFKHLIPNVVSSIIVAVTFAIPTAIYFEAFLSYIGLGLKSPMASLGVLINDGIEYYQDSPHLLFFPSVIICLIMFAFNLLGDGLRDALDPRMRK